MENQLIDNEFFLINAIEKTNELFKDNDSNVEDDFSMQKLNSLYIALKNMENRLNRLTH